MKNTKVKLTDEEKRLLEYPPTETTWYCDQHVGTYTAKDGEERTTPRRVTNPGSRSCCWACLTPKPAHAPLAWPIYQEAREKTGADLETPKQEEPVAVRPLPRRSGRSGGVRRRTVRKR